MRRGMQITLCANERPSWGRSWILSSVSSVMFLFFSFFLAACRRNRRVFARVSNSLACSASISAIGSVPAHSMRDQLLLPRALNGDNGATSKAGNQMAGKRRGAIESRLPYKCRAQLPVKITRSLISSKSKSRAVRNKRFPFAQKGLTYVETIFFFRDLL